MFSEFFKSNFDTGFQNVDSFLQMDVLCKTVRRQDKLWIQLKQSNLALPPRLPGFNPIKNDFNFVKSKLRAQAFEKNIVYETFEQFSVRVKHILENTSTK